jgi:ABC-type Mn2+/Zn2+ transport system permease subunit
MLEQTYFRQSTDGGQSFMLWCWTLGSVAFILGVSLAAFWLLPSAAAVIVLAIPCVCFVLIAVMDG